MTKTFGAFGVMMLAASLSLAGPVKPPAPAPKPVKVAPPKPVTNKTVEKSDNDGDKDVDKGGKRAMKHDSESDRRDLKADEAELKHLQADLKVAEAKGNSRRAAHDRTAIARLEKDLSADRADITDDKHEAKPAAHK